MARLGVVAILVSSALLVTGQEPPPEVPSVKECLDAVEAQDLDGCAPPPLVSFVAISPSPAPVPSSSAVVGLADCAEGGWVIEPAFLDGSENSYDPASPATQPVFRLLVMLGMDPADPLYPSTVGIRILGGYAALGDGVWDALDSVVTWQSEDKRVGPGFDIAQFREVPYREDGIYQIVLDGVRFCPVDLPSGDAGSGGLEEAPSPGGGGIPPLGSDETESGTPSMEASSEAENECTSGYVHTTPPWESEEWGKNSISRHYQYSSTEAATVPYSEQSWTKRHTYFDCNGQETSNSTYLVGYLWQGDQSVEASAVNEQSMNFAFHVQGRRSPNSCGGPPGEPQPQQPPPYPGYEPPTCWEKTGNPGSMAMVIESRAFVPNQQGLEFVPTDPVSIYGFETRPMECDETYEYSWHNWAGIGLELLGLYGAGPWGSLLASAGLALSSIPGEETLCVLGSKTFETDWWGREGLGIMTDEHPSDMKQVDFRGAFRVFYREPDDNFCFENHGQFVIKGIGRAVPRNDPTKGISTVQEGWGWGSQGKTCINVQ